MSDLEKYLKYKNKYIKYKKSQMTGGFAFMDTKEEKYLLRYINDFLNKNDTKSFFNYNGTTPIKTFDETVNRFNSNEYLKIYEYLIDLYYDPEKYSRTYNEEEIKDIHKYHIHFAALILINYFAELELHTLFYYDYGVNTVSKTDRNNIKCLIWSDTTDHDATRIYLDDVYEDVNTKIQKLCKELDDLFYKFMEKLTIKISAITNDTRENISNIINPLKNGFKSIRIDWKKKIEEKYKETMFDLNNVIIDCLNIFIKDEIIYIAEGIGFYGFMYLTFNRKKNTSIHYGSCIDQSLFELYIMTRLHTKPQNINLFLETPNKNIRHKYDKFIQSKLNIYSVTHWSTGFNLSNSEKHKKMYRQRQMYSDETKLNFLENKLDFVKACFYTVYDMFNVMNNNLKEKKSVEFEKFINERVNFFENKLFDKLYETRYINGSFEKSFYMAVLNGNIGKLESFNREQLECTVIRNKDLIHIISFKGDVKMLNFLLKIYERNNVNKDIVLHNYTDNMHPIFVASMNGHANIVETLLNNIVNLDKEHIISAKYSGLYYGLNDGLSSLFIASMNGHTNVIEILLKNIQDKQKFINAKCKKYTPLYIASENGHTNVVQILLENVLDKDNYMRTLCQKFTPLCIASQNGHINVIQMLLDNVLDKDDYIKTQCDGTTPLYIASENGHTDVVQMLLDNVVNKDDYIKTQCDGATPLYIASEFGHTDVVRMLLDNVLDKDDYIKTQCDGSTPLYIASEFGHTDVVQMLLDNVLDKDDYIKTQCDGATPLYIASENGHTDIVQMLLENVLDKDDYIKTQCDEATPLYIASENGHTDIVRMLLDNVLD